MTEILNDTISDVKELWKLMETIPDPEIPVISITDLGIVRHIEMDGKNVEVSITPTYSGCPAMDMISMQIKMELLSRGFVPVIKTVLSPAWTTDWITPAAKEKLNAYGIAPPSLSSNKDAPVHCPQCNSSHTEMISHFGSTACKALYRCNDCKECFDLFKCH